MTGLIAGRAYLLNDDRPIEALKTVSAIDRLEYDGASLDIAQTRDLILRANEKPFGAVRLIIIKSADRLSFICQNALLKTLEEPSPTALIALITQQPERLLPTVLSRLLRYSNKKTQEVVASKLTYEQLLNFKGDREALINQLANQRQSLRSRLADSKDPKLLRELEIITQAETFISRGSNIKLTLDWLSLRLSEQSGIN